MNDDDRDNCPRCGEKIQMLVGGGVCSVGCGWWERW